jgi:hypothetical protein
MQTGSSTRAQAASPPDAKRARMGYRVLRWLDPIVQLRPIGALRMRAA